jgi:hypothetical protein
MTDRIWIDILYLLVGMQGFYICLLIRGQSRMKKLIDKVFQALLIWEESAKGLQEMDSRLFKMLHELGDIVKSLYRNPPR